LLTYWLYDKNNSWYIVYCFTRQCTQRVYIETLSCEANFQNIWFLRHAFYYWMKRLWFKQRLDKGRLYIILACQKYRLKTSPALLEW